MPGVVERFPVVDLEGWTRGEREPGGDEAKRWFIAPPESSYDGHWLFKPRRVKELALSKERQRRGDKPDVLIRGENWAEKIAYELAVLLGVPSAETHLASVIELTSGSRVYGSMSRDMRPRTWSWAPGAALLAEYDDEFDTDSCRGHTLEAIRDVLAGMDGPVASEYADWPAFDVFTGYLMLDAWIANTDRHAHNWGVLQNLRSGYVCLSPSFDHGSALASGNGDPDRAARVDGKAVASWCERGRTKRFDGGEVQSLLEQARRALSMASPDAGQYWIDRMTGVDLGVCFDVIEATPDLSDSTRRFLHTAVSTNRKRLCDALH